MNNSIYIKNKYHDLYHSIINNAKSNIRSKGKGIYYENMVLLTAREHYICHYLLTKFTLSKYKSKMVFGFNLMNCGKN